MAEKHFHEQKRHAARYLVPHLRKRCPGFNHFRILEIGCAEGGFLSALMDIGIRATGLDLSPGRVKLAKSFDPRPKILVGDAVDPGLPANLGRPFDIVVMLDVIEHVSERGALFLNLGRLLKPRGFVFVTFPPKHSPFAGHHQNGRSILRFVPYLHLLPEPLLRFAGKCSGEFPHIIDAATANAKTGLSIRSFERLCKTYGFRFVEKKLFFIRPVYRTRFDLRPVSMPDIPLVREIAATGCECLLKKRG